LQLRTDYTVNINNIFAQSKVQHEVVFSPEGKDQYKTDPSVPEGKIDTNINRFFPKELHTSGDEVCRTANLKTLFD